MGNLAYYYKKKKYYKRLFNVDHDHKTGKVRGLLCTGCNLSLGHFDSKEILQSLINYLGGKNVPII